VIDIDARVVDGKLRGITVERLCAAVEWRVYRTRQWVAQRKRRRYIAGVQSLLSELGPSRCYDSEALFAKLQREYLAPDPYGYDTYSTWRRGTERAQSILNLSELRQPGQRVLELAAGDGMTAEQLSGYGHAVTVCDLEDWRDARARSFAFLQCDICEGIPLEDDSFELIYSYNAFEHLADPASAFGEIERICRPGGLVLLSFGPLYCSPWGLHAYRALNMPYPQYLFSREFVDEKVKLLGLYALGRDMSSIQPLNGWRLAQYQQLWHGGWFQILEERVQEDWTHLGMVVRFPEAFRGRGLRVTDLVAGGVHVLLKKEPVLSGQGVL
jgi:SAM-dependent methyltransferase